MEWENWMEEAKNDFDAAQFNANGGYRNIAVFRFQQAVEKALEAVLICRGKGLMKTHDCLLLAQECDAPAEIQEKADTVSSFYMRNRYPDSESITITDALLERVQTASREVLKWTESKLSKND